MASARSAALDVVHRPRTVGPALRQAVNPVGVHVLGVAGRVVAHRVQDHGRVIARRTDVEGGMFCVAVALVRVVGLPIVLPEMRLRERDQHAHVVSGFEDLRKAQVRAWLAAVVVRVDEVDADVLESPQAFPGDIVAGPQSADLGVVQRQRRKKDPRAVEVEIPSFDPEFAEAERSPVAHVERFAGGIQQRDGQLILVLGGVDVPQFFRLPFLGQRDATLLQVRGLERLAGEFRDLAILLRNLGSDRVPAARIQVVQGGCNPNGSLPHGGVHLDIADPGRCGRAHQVHIAAQAAPRDGSSRLLRRGRVAERHHDRLQRQRQHIDAEGLPFPQPARRGDIHLAGRKANLARFLAVEVNDGVGIDVLRTEHDPPAGPCGGYDDLPLVPGSSNLTQSCPLPVRMGEDLLAILLQVVRDPRPGPRHLEVAPILGRHTVGVFSCGLPAPQTVDANPFSRGRPLAICFVEVPDGFDARRKRCFTRRRHRGPRSFRLERARFFGCQVGDLQNLATTSARRVDAEPRPFRRLACSRRPNRCDRQEDREGEHVGEPVSSLHRVVL